MRRIQFIELHEQPWFPSSLRDDVTDAVQFGFNLMKAYVPVAPLLQRVLLQSVPPQSVPLQTVARQTVPPQTVPPQSVTGSGKGTHEQSIVDMCSGGGGPWLDLCRELRCGDAAEFTGLQVWLTDKYPNLEAFQNISASSGHHITYYAESVDAMNVPRALKGMRTMFTSFHHFAPDDARAVLQDAVDAGESVGIFEITQRTPSAIALIVIGTFLMFFHTPRIRPFRWSRLLWTYLIPIIPLVLLFDGVVSCLRTYRPQELRGIVNQLTPRQYQWEIGELAGKRAPVTYLIGYPKVG